jgi:phage terminase large subunit
LFDQRTKQWTPFGLKYIAKLDALTGVRKLRLRQGIWAMAEGMIYADVYDPARNLIDRFDIPPEWPRWWSVDFGYTKPFCWQCWAVDNDGRGYLSAEIYHTKRLVEDHCKTILAWMKRTGEDWPRALITDHDAEDRATMERHLGISTEPAIKSILDGNQLCAERLRPAGDGRARLFLLRDALLERDVELEEAKLPAATVEEFESYVWDEKKDQPVDAFNHGMDAMRYFVHWYAAHNSPGVHL